MLSLLPILPFYTKVVVDTWSLLTESYVYHSEAVLFIELYSP